MSRPARSVSPALVLALVLAGSSPASADGGSVYSNGLFQLGDGQQPAGFAGAADIAATPGQAGPDWEDIFDSVGGLRDDYPLDDAGAPQGNGVPDLVDRFGGRWAVFVADDVSLGSGFEGTAAAGAGDLVRNGVVSAAADIGNAYLYGTRDGSGNPVVFMALERLSGADGSVEFEIDQATVRLGHGGYGQGAPWRVNGTRAADDLLVRVTFSGGAVAGVELLRWNEGAWELLAAVTGEGCDAAELLCSLSNREPIAAGPWPSYDTGGDPHSIGAGRFVELGVNVGALLGSHPVAQSIRVRTSEDIAFGYVVEGN